MITHVSNILNKIGFITTGEELEANGSLLHVNSNVGPYQVLPLGARVDWDRWKLTIRLSPSDCLVSYRGRSLRGGLTPLQRCSQCILQPQLTGQPKKKVKVKLKDSFSSPKHLLPFIISNSSIHTYTGESPWHSVNLLDCSFNVSSNACHVIMFTFRLISKLATIVEGDPKAPFSIAYYTKV